MFDQYALLRFARVSCVIAGALFAYAAISEVGYASSHPHSYGPAVIIALASGAGALLSCAGWALASVASIGKR